MWPFKLPLVRKKPIVFLKLKPATLQKQVWKPVAAHCATLGPRFRFFHLNPWPGFKAGALNFALRETAPDAEIIGVVDSDYVVSPQWLRHFVPHFLSDPAVAVVQAPQAHQEWERNAFRRMCNWEFEGFFRIGMHHRNERNALIQHGTMTMVRRRALEEVGGWSEWCICEDTELGLRLFIQSMLKVRGTELRQSIYELLVDIAGPDAVPFSQEAQFLEHLDQAAVDPSLVAVAANRGPPGPDTHATA